MYPKLGSVYVNYILGGLSFLSGHIFFITAILKADRAVFPDTPIFPAKQLIAAALLDFAVIAVMLLCKLKLGKFLAPVAVYAFALMMTVVKAFSLGTGFHVGRLADCGCFQLNSRTRFFAFCGIRPCSCLGFFHRRQGYQKEKSQYNIVLLRANAYGSFRYVFGGVDLFCSHSLIKMTH